MKVSEIHSYSERLFITVHQNFEVWFSQILYDMTSVRDIFLKSDLNISREEALLCTKRILRTEKILKHTFGSFDILETMHPSGK